MQWQIHYSYGRRAHSTSVSAFLQTNKQQQKKQQQRENWLSASVWNLSEKI